MMKLKQQEGTPIYPDANSTLRLTYGKIGSYSPKDGVEYSYYTTLKGVMEKEDPDNFEFVVPAKLKELYNNKDFGRYAMKNGEMPICFGITALFTLEPQPPATIPANIILSSPHIKKFGTAVRPELYRCVLNLLYAVFLQQSIDLCVWVDDL